MSWAVWITGLPGSGKSVIARAVAAALAARGTPVAVLELDAIRKTLTPAPSYSDDERELVYRSLVWLAKVLTEAGVPSIIDATGHRRRWRDLARANLPAFAEVQLTCPLAVCRLRERQRPLGHAPQGIYASAGRPAATVPGVDVPYEPALAPEVVVDTEHEDVAAAVARIVPLTLELAPKAPAFRPRPGVGWAIWITGLPGSGKSAVASAVAERLAADGVPVVILDPADVREFVLGYRGGLPFEEEVVHRAMVYAAKLLTDAGQAVVIDATGARRAWRQLARALIGRYAEVQLVCPTEICGERERRARWAPPPCAHGGGRRAPVAPGPDVALDYEPCPSPEVTIHTDVRDLASAVDEVLMLARRLVRGTAATTIHPEGDPP